MFRWTFRIGIVFLAILLVTFLVIFRGALYNRFFVFPKQVAAWSEIRAERNSEKLPYTTAWKHYKGTAHNHSHFSHDSEVPFERILEILNETNHDFIAMSDHCLEGGRADYGVQWRGIHDGKLFIPGFEMQRGFMPWGLPNDTVLDCGKEPEALAQEIEDKGGILFFAHPEEERDWYLPQLSGMEIYNTHADIKDEKLALLAPDILLNFGKYPEQTIRLIFDRNTKILQVWDDLNTRRDISGLAANDCHQNTGIYGIYTSQGNLDLYHSSGEKMKEYKLNFFTRLLLRLFTGPLTAGEEAFRLQLDPYDLMTRYVVTHVFAADLTEEAILDAFKDGRMYIGFDMIADSTDFMFVAKNESQTVVMGERLVLTPNTWLAVASPYRCRITVMKDGQQVYQTVGVLMDWQPKEPGKYRIEAELDILGEWTPWVYTNPIELKRDISTIGS